MTAWQLTGKLRSYPHTAREAAFLLGGIGTGNVSLGSRGELRDWEIFNQPNKGGRLANTYFTIRTQTHTGAVEARVLEAQLQPPFNGAHGIAPRFGGGLPRLAGACLEAEYPLARVTFYDTTLPVQVVLESFTPFVPLNPDDSGLPCALLRYRVRNVSSEAVDVTVAGSIMNPVGSGAEPNQPGDMSGRQINEVRDTGCLRGLFMHSAKVPHDHLLYGNLALATPATEVTLKPYWLRGAWFDELQDFWQDLVSDGRFTDLGYCEPSPDKKNATGSLGIYARLHPGEEKEFLFVLAWYFPNRPRGWGSMAEGAPESIIKNHYATAFGDAWDVATYVTENLARLERETLAFHQALFSSSLPVEMLDAAAANITVLRSPTCFWLENGSFLGWEGCHDKSGCCPGNCTHVWNYAQTLAFLFPSLERTMRVLEFGQEVDKEGKMAFRVGKVFSPLYNWNRAAADGQLGCVMRLYRDWKMSGDREFLAGLWEQTKSALEYAFRVWDTDRDLVLDGEQHNTYDIEFYGPNPLTGLFFVGALKAAAAMAQALGDAVAAERYANAAATASERLDNATWNGDYYVQRLTDVDEHKYQFGQGCLSDQMLAQTLAHLYGLGYLLPQEKVRSAVRAIFTYNWRSDCSHHVNVQRAYVFNDEAGLLLCSWPHGGRPRFPFVYSDEVWTGIEYQVATHLIYEGCLDEARRIVKAVRDRHDGVKRNPWNEVECGHHYARATASWGLVVAMSGFQCDMAKRSISFHPAVDGEFATFWSTGQGWGTYRQYRNESTGELVPEVQVLYGDMQGVTVKACGREWVL